MFVSSSHLFSHLDNVTCTALEEGLFVLVNHIFWPVLLFRAILVIGNVNFSELSAGPQFFF